MAAFPYPRHIHSKPVAKIVDGNKVGGNSDIARYEMQINHKGLCPSSCLTSSAEAAFFDGPNTESYCDLLSNHLLLFLEELPLNVRREMWFQQDGVPLHFSRATRTLLNEIFGDRWISRGGPLQWPPRSFDLIPLNYFLWGYVKEKVMFKSHTPTAKEDLKRRIHEKKIFLVYS
ncbi:hypothetical protein ALC60_12123 [Trachymyrmex zeteki]|uniref:Transposable element Tc3 transposase n=1 Tax=Mycetomoellerius zeteki TaxID=64791 RepID=A0A151WMJ1_9HYME|nr:hypothetical protein ALC60_12123 [Trachymyrmex zeteki]